MQAPLTPHLAGEITRLILEFESINRQRALVDALIELGVDSDSYARWDKLQKRTAFAVPAPLANDVKNLIGQVEKGIQITSNQLTFRSKSSIERAVKAISAAQALLLAEVDAAKDVNDVQRDVG